MTRVSKIFLFLCLLISAPVYASREITIGYQGVIDAKGNVLDQVGFFKFALCDKDCATSFWSNDNKSVAGSEPSDFVAVPISKGVFNVLLGDTLERMDAIPVSVFKDVGDSNLYLRVWFSDGVNGFEALTPDHRISIVPYTARAEMVGDLFNTGPLTLTGGLSMTGNLSVQMEDASSATPPFQVGTSTTTLFSVNSAGTATSRSVVLEPLTSSSDLNRLETGRLYYDGENNKFMGCNATSCAEIGLAGATGVGDITSVTASTGLSGGGTTGALTLSVDTGTVVTKTGDHSMTGTLTAAGVTATTMTATTLSATSLTAGGAVSADSLSVATTATTGGVTLAPTGVAAGNTAELRLRELAANGTHYVGFKAPDSISDVYGSVIWALPVADGVDGQVLSTNGAGAMEWVTPKQGDITDVIAGNGLSGSVSQAGIANINVGAGTGITFTGDSNSIKVNMIDVVDGAGGTSNFSGLEAGGTLAAQFGLLQGCANNQVLKWSESASTWGCAGITPTTESVTDNTLYVDLPNGVGAIAEVMDSYGEPSITPDAATNRIWVSGSILITSADVDSETSTFRIYRDTEDDALCDGTQVGVDLSLATSAVGTFSIPFSFIDSPALTSAQYYSVCGYTNTATTPNDVAVIMLTIQEVPAAGADLAELYATTDTTIQAGTVVSLDAGLPLGVKKSPQAYDTSVLGVISTDPGLLLDDGVSPGAAVPVALSGRVPVQVTTHEGADPIDVGDYLTSSEIPGVAMKAKHSGTVIGKALSRLAAGTGHVFMFVEQGYQDMPGDPLAGSVATDASGLAWVDFKNFIGAVKPIVQLTVESDAPAFAQVSEFLTDAMGNTTGFAIKTFAPSGEISPRVMVHYQVVKGGGHD